MTLRGRTEFGRTGTINIFVTIRQIVKGSSSKKWTGGS
jgi:hypothetical protein